MMQMTSQTSSLRQSSSSSTKSATVVRNYENHEIIMRHSDKGPSGGGGGRSNTKLTTTTTTSTSKTSSSTSVIFRNAEPEMGNLLDLRGDEDLSLVQKTKALSLMPLATSESVGGDQDAAKASGTDNGDLLEPYHRNGLNLPNGTVTKTGKFTGAIPKSISFDASADKRHDGGHHHNNNKHQRSLDNNSHGHSHHQHHRGGGHSRGVSQNSSFLNKIRQGLKNSGRKSNKHSNGPGNKDEEQHTNWDTFNNNNNSSSNHSNGGGDVGNLIDMEDVEPAYQETSEDILAKYRRKVSTASSEANASDSTTGSRASSSFKSKNSTDSDFRSSANGDMLRLSMPPVTASSSTDSFQFSNAKKKLRTVLSSADVHTTDFRYNLDNNFEYPLLVYLKIQMAQALNLDDLQQLAYVQEAIRCLMQMSLVQRQSLVATMYADMGQRQKYLKYLMRLRQGMLGALKSVERYEERLKRDREMCNRHLIDCCVRLFMEKRECLVDKLQEQFAELTQLGDEKIDLLEEFIVQLMAELGRSGISEWQLADARISVERILLQRLYRQVMFPNDDADILRDQ